MINSNDIIEYKQTKKQQKDVWPHLRLVKIRSTDLTKPSSSRRMETETGRQETERRWECDARKRQRRKESERRVCRQIWPPWPGPRCVSIRRMTKTCYCCRNLSGISTLVLLNRLKMCIFSCSHENDMILLLASVANRSSTLSLVSISVAMCVNVAHRLRCQWRSTTLLARKNRGL